VKSRETLESGETRFCRFTEKKSSEKAENEKTKSRESRAGIFFIKLPSFLENRNQLANHETDNVYDDYR
jgi:hypothetical protein